MVGLVGFFQRAKNEIVRSLPKNHRPVLVHWRNLESVDSGISPKRRKGYPFAPCSLLRAPCSVLLQNNSLYTSAVSAAVFCHVNCRARAQPRWIISSRSSLSSDKRSSAST